jgi:hypothetical protein
MDITTGRILKAKDVKLQGCFHLDIARPANPAGPARTASASPQVRIVETHTDFAVMEITCACGTQTRIRCEYGEKKIK